MFYLIENSLVIQKQPNEPDDLTGWIESALNGVPGMSWDGLKFIDIPEDIELVKSKLKELIKSSMYLKIEQGVKWAENPGANAYDVPLSDSMQGFLSRTLMKLNEGRTNPHNGFIFNGSENFNINDEGIKELALFSGAWGDEISRIKLDVIGNIDNMTDSQIRDFDVNSIDWSVDWSLDSQNNGLGWDDNLVNQNP